MSDALQETERSDARRPFTQYAVERLTTEGLLIAAATAMGYFLALQYERAYCAFFGVPPFLVAPTLPVIAGSVAAVLLALFAAVIFLPALLRDMLDSLGGMVVFAIGFVLFVVFGVIAVINGGWATRVVVLMGFLGGATAMFHWKAQHFGIKVQGEAVVLIAVVFTALSFFAPMLGYVAAGNVRVFHTLPDQRDVVVIRNYGDVLIGVRVDRAKLTLKSETIVIRLADKQRQLALYREELGRLVGYSWPTDD